MRPIVHLARSGRYSGDPHRPHREATALGVAGELRAERETRMRNAQWWSVVDAEATALLESGRLPRLAAVGQAAIDDVDGVFDHALTHYLDGVAALP